jgi:signal transduction histidine kinase
MTVEKPALAMDGAQFFGEMTASISHEIKNVMAIINENAGLLEDMVAMHRRGVPFPPDRIEKLAQSVSRQLTRADGIIQTMNRFAHSADHAWEAVDLGETALLMAQLAKRLIMVRGAKFEIPTPPKAVSASTNRFFLEYVIWRSMVAAMAMPRPGTPIRIQAEATAQGPCLRFSRMDMGNTVSSAALSSLEANGVLALLGARLEIDSEGGVFRILFSGKGNGHSP